MQIRRRTEMDDSGLAHALASIPCDLDILQEAGVVLLPFPLGQTSHVMWSVAHLRTRDRCSHDLPNRCATHHNSGNCRGCTQRQVELYPVANERPLSSHKERCTEQIDVPAQNARMCPGEGPQHRPLRRCNPRLSMRDACEVPISPLSLGVMAQRRTLEPPSPINGECSLLLGELAKARRHTFLFLTSLPFSSFPFLPRGAGRS